MKKGNLNNNKLTNEKRLGLHEFTHGNYYYCSYYAVEF